MRPLALLLWLTSAAAAASSAPAPAAGFSWPAPKGWKSETIPFPLDFAPDLPHRGLEELRFAPGFFDPRAPGYWSYAFVWWLEDSPKLDAATLGGELERYFRGLSQAVGGKKYSFESRRFKARLVAAGSGFSGTIDTYDAFATGQPLVLNVRIRQLDCRAAGRRAVLMALSPQPAGAPIWAALRERVAAFRCP